jgi:hypothetical protein
VAIVLAIATLAVPASSPRLVRLRSPQRRRKRRWQSGSRSPPAGADEVVVSSTVKDLVVGSGISFSDRGTRELKGVPGEWRLFAVDQVEAPASSRLVPETRERFSSFTTS